MQLRLDLAKSKNSDLMHLLKFCNVNVVFVFLVKIYVFLILYCALIYVVLLFVPNLVRCDDRALTWLNQISMIC